MEFVSTHKSRKTAAERIARRLERQRRAQAKMARRGESRRGGRAMRVREAVEQSLAL